MTNRRPLLAVPVLLALAAAGCSTGGAGRPVRTVVVTRTATAPATGSPGGTATAPTGASPSATATGMSELPGTCDDLLPAAAVDNALGRALKGRTAFVVGLPEKDIGRIGYINCRYGLPAGAAGQSSSAVAAAEIGVSLYRSDSLAAARIPATVEDYTAHGASSKDTRLNGQDATILTGGAGAGYTEPTIVAVSGRRTIAVSVHEPAGAGADKDLAALAELALTHTGG